MSLNLETVPEEALREILALREAEQRLTLREKAKDKFMPFVHHVYDGFIEGRHHRVIAEKLEKIAKGELKRLIVNMPPRHSKSEFASYLMPAWFLGRNPKLKIIQATHNTELAVRFGRKVRDLIADPHFKDIFPKVDLKADSKAAGRWETSVGGEYFAAGVGAAVTGRGADLFIIDDPHSEQDALSESAFDNAFEWYTSGPRQRLQPGGSIIVVMTRWGMKDLTGRLIKAQGSDVMSDTWEVVEFPAIMPSDDPLWPEFWNKDDLLKVKASLPVAKWNAQWQQQPTATEGAIVKKESADYSAITTWGIFNPNEGEADHIVLMDARRGRWNFPELKGVAGEEYEYWEPDMVIVEAKASGMPLTDELRRAGVPVMNYTPAKGRDKVTRMHTVAPLFEAGMVWAPEKGFADEVIEECAAFPNGDYDDYVDSMTMALIRFRQGGFVTLEGEDARDEDWYPRKREYY